MEPGQLPPKCMLYKPTAIIHHKHTARIQTDTPGVTGCKSYKNLVMIHVQPLLPDSNYINIVSPTSISESIAILSVELPKKDQQNQ